MLDPSLKYLGDLNTRPVIDAATNTLKEFAGTSNDLKTRWRDDRTLALLLGRVAKRPPKFGVRSEVYIGDLKGALLRPNFKLEIALGIEDFELASESHTAAAAYAIAMDAKARGVDRALVVKLLRVASQYANGDDPTGAIKALQVAIDRTLNSIAESP